MHVRRHSEIPVPVNTLDHFKSQIEHLTHKNVRLEAEKKELEERIRILSRMYLDLRLDASSRTPGAGNQGGPTPPLSPTLGSQARTEAAQLLEDFLNK